MIYITKFSIHILHFVIYHNTAGSGVV